MYVILAENGGIMLPTTYKWQPEGVVVPTNGVFVTREGAKLFGEYLARRYGLAYHLFGREATVKPQAPPVVWEDTP